MVLGLTACFCVVDQPDRGADPCAEERPADWRARGKKRMSLSVTDSSAVPTL